MASTWMEIFKAGTHTSGNGVTKEYTVDDIKNIAKTYNEQKDHEAPLVLGHPATDDPAHGWAKELKEAGGKLLAYVDQINEKIVSAVERGEYKKISIAIYPNGLLRHIGLLGATPPAVKGLAPVQFAEDMEFDEYVWVTDEVRMPIVGRMLSGIRDFFIEKFGIDVADKVLDKDDISRLQSSAPENVITVKEEQQENNYSEQEVNMENEKIKALEDKIKKQSEDFTSMFGELQKGFTELSNLVKTQAEATAKQIKETAATSAKSSFAAFCDGLIKDGKVLPAEREDIVEEYADLLNAEGSMEFAEGSVLPSERLKNRLAARQPLYAGRKPVFANADRAKTKTDSGATEVPVEFAEFGDKRIDPASLDLDAQIKEYAEQNKVSYEEACAAFMR